MTENEVAVEFGGFGVVRDGLVKVLQDEVDCRQLHYMPEANVSSP